MLNAYFHKLSNTGDTGFEGLILQLMRRLTGLEFRLARSGSQHGRDGEASRPSGSVTFECKNYLDKTTLPDRDLVAEVVQAINDKHALDVWLLVASKPISTQTMDELDKAAQKRIDIHALTSTDDGSGLLDCLCAVFADTVLEFFRKNSKREVDFWELGSNLTSIRSKADTRARVDQLRILVEKPTAGWPAWQRNSHQRWISIVSDHNESRGLFGQSLDVLGQYSIVRRNVHSALTEWWTKWPDSPRPFIAMGEEGNGKTWSISQWLSSKMNVDGSTFPPVVFIPSQDAVGDDLSELICRFLRSHHRGQPDEFNWDKRLEKWKRSPLSRGASPVCVLVLDGLNERNSPGYWRKLLDAASTKEWIGSLAVICTVRTTYWNDHFQRLNQWDSFTKFEVKEFDDEEVSEALSRRNRRLADFSVDLQPLLRKPRYLDLALCHHARLAEYGDYTPARLVYEDWLDKHRRKVNALSDTGFNELLQRLASKWRDGLTQLAPKEVEELLSHHEDPRHALEELSSSGVFQKQRGFWKVEKNRLSLGFALLLCDELSDLTEATITDLSERISQWIEPHRSMDIECEILEKAALHSLLSDCDVEIQVALLLAWLKSQNPANSDKMPVDTRFVSYLPARFEAYVRVAEIIWSDQRNHPWGQEVLLRGLIRWGAISPTVRNQLPGVFERWLGIVPREGPPILRDFNGALSAPIDFDQVLRATLGTSLTDGPTCFAGYSLLIAEDDGWLRLPRAALAVI